MNAPTHVGPIRPEAESGVAGAARARPAAARNGLLGRWVALWDEREPPTVLALIRILLALVLLVDLAEIGRHELWAWLWVPPEAGGLAPFDVGEPPLFYRLLPPSAGSARLLWLGLAGSVLCFGLGLFTRSSAAVFVFAYSQAAAINPVTDRAIDTAIRIVMSILALSACGKVWSVDARLASGRFRGTEAAAPAWPRYLLALQLVVLYCSAGFAKSGTRWYPWGGYEALYLTLRDPIYATHDFAWLAAPVAHLGTQLATAATHLWELAAPLVLVAAYCRRTAARPGRLRRLVNRLPVRDTYVLLGVTFHLLLAATLRLGIFPFAMLALYPAFFRPAELARWLPRRRAR